MKKQRTTSSKSKTRTNRNSLAGKTNGLFKNRMLSKVFVVLIITAGLFTVAVTNVPGLNPFKTAALTPSIELCTVASTPLCLNRKGGSENPGTPIIGYAQLYDQNNNFYAQPSTGACNHGHVTVSPPCPFAQRALDIDYFGMPILEIRESSVPGTSLSSAYCLGSTANGDGVLDFCPDNAGQHGSNGVLFVSRQYGASSPFYLVNVFQSDQVSGYNYPQDSHPRWLCLYANRSVAILDATAGTAKVCQFRHIYQPNNPI